MAKRDKRRAPIHARSDGREKHLLITIGAHRGEADAGHDAATVLVPVGGSLERV
jgi:hypothetical protein